MATNFENLTDDVCYTEVNQTFKLEESTGNYSLECRQVSGEALTIIRPDKIKSLSKFIKCNPPKDCDYILVNEARELIFFIELKKSSDTSSAGAVKEQLRCGKKWFDHICFVLDEEESFNDYGIFLIHSVVDARQDRKRRLEPKQDVFKVNGSRLNLMEFYNITDHRFRQNLADFQ